MKIVSMKQFRQSFSPIHRALNKGESFLLMYRSKPIAIIRPYDNSKDIHLLSPQKEVPKLDQQQLKTLPEPKKIAIEPSNVPQLPSSTKDNQPKNNNPLNKFGLKRAFI